MVTLMTRDGRSTTKTGCLRSALNCSSLLVRSTSRCTSFSGISTDNPAQLNVPPGHLGLTEARDDPVADLGAFGGDPNHLPGITNLSAEAATTPDGTPLSEATGHSEYLAPGTTSQYNLGATVAGLPDNRIPTTDNSGFGDWLRRWGV